MRRLSLRAASRCETAQCKKCKCRCGGKLHGAKRGDGPEFYNALPRDDPHFARPKREPKPRVPKPDPVDAPGALFEGVWPNVTGETPL